MKIIILCINELRISTSDCLYEFNYLRTTMESTRQQKFSKQIQREISDIFQKHGKDFYGSAFVTVTKVNVTPDLGLARVNLSLFKQVNPNDILERIRKHKGEIRKHLGNKLKDTIHHIPDLDFYIDNSLDYVEKIDSLLNQIEIPKQGESKMDESDYKKLD